MTLVQLDNYPVAVYFTKDLFQLSPQVVPPSLTSFAPGNVMIHLLAKVDKESEAKKGIVKLMLLHIRGNNNIGIEHQSNHSIERNAGSSESTLCSSSQSICRSCVNDIRVGQATRLHQHPINSDFNSGHVKDPCIPYAPREFCNREGYQSQTRGQFSGTIRFSSTEE